MADNTQGKSGENRKEETNKEYGRQGKYAKGNKKNSDNDNN
ncbi:hypothetical protein [Gracilibacillus kekensis]|uniref:Uncharacterized protein n=1 Tax=Gracilibacillus kekensis TaxID=1027249 RepID=A0A1M7QHK2_9BACI|nr:hypothetical protein [Gracilibacillus kekensis]SHN30369.1 hypothetical protein SAMN05216179_3169 [Gracilibacillus kekensis]